MTGQELGLLALERRLRGSLINVYRYLMGGKENRQTSHGSSVQGQDERQWAQIGRFEIPSEHMKTLSTQENNFVVVVKQGGGQIQKKLPRQAGEASAVEMLKTQLETVLVLPL